MIFQDIEPQSIKGYDPRGKETKVVSANHLQSSGCGTGRENSSGACRFSELGWI